MPRNSQNYLDNNHLPTPGSTPTPESPPEDREYDSLSGSSQSAHTAIPIHHNSNTTMPNSEEFGTPAQRQAAHVTNILHKTQIKPSLSLSNYAAWADSVRFGLSAVSFDSFLESDDVEEGEEVDERRHVATKKCIFN